MAKNGEGLDEGIDFSGLINFGDDGPVEGGAGGFGGGTEIDSIEDIDKSIEELNKTRNKTPEDDGDQTGKTKVVKDDKTESVESEEGAEETEEEEVADEGETTPAENNDEGDGDSPFKIFANFLKEKGLIDFEDKSFEDTEEFLLSRVEDKIKAGINEYKESLSPEGREILDAIEAGIPAEAILQRNSAIDTYESLTDEEIDENEALQKSLVRNLYTSQGYSKEATEKKIKRLDDAGLLADEAKDAKIELAEMIKNQKEQLKAEQEQANQDRIKRFEDWKKSVKETLDSKDEVIAGFKMSDEQKKIIHRGMTEFDKEGKNEVQRMMEQDPLFNIKVAYMALVRKWDFSGIDKKAMSSATKKLRDSIESSDKLRGGSGAGPAHKSNGAIDFKLIEKTMRKM